MSNARLRAETVKPLGDITKRELMENLVIARHRADTRKEECAARSALVADVIYGLSVLNGNDKHLAARGKPK